MQIRNNEISIKEIKEIDKQMKQMIDYQEENNQKCKIDEVYVKEVIKENKENAKEFNMDLEEYFLLNSTSINMINRESLIKYYYEYLKHYPNEWLIIVDLFTPFENESINLLFDIIELLMRNDYNFERKYNKLRIIK